MNFLKNLFGSGDNMVSTTDVKAQLDNKAPLFILDVRQPEEFRSGHIPGAVLIPLNELARRQHEIPKDREIVCVCRSGARSSSATRQLISAGYQARNMQGGMIAWQSAHYPVKKGK